MTHLKTLLTAAAIIAATVGTATARDYYRERPHEYTYSCDLNRAFPASPPDERNPTTDTAVTISRNRIVVRHILANGEVKTRNGQYRQGYKQTTKGFDDGEPIRWSGKRGSLSMEGIFVLGPGGDGPASYSEEQRDGGRLSFAAVWSCSLPRRE